MPENWKPYLCNVNDELASILVDLGLADIAPDNTKPWLLWIWLYMRAPRADGLSDSEEAPRLYEVEDALAAALSARYGAVVPGRITTQGRREFYYYGVNADNFSETVESVMGQFPDYAFNLGAQEDRSWSQYYDVLFPSPKDMQRIGNRDVLDLLEKQGDDHSIPRPVEHWIYFHSDPARALFKDEAIRLGFLISGESKSEGNPPFGISISRVEPVTQESVDGTVLQLLELSERFEGEYDGWETQAVDNSASQSTQ